MQRTSAKPIIIFTVFALTFLPASFAAAENNRERDTTKDVKVEVQEALEAIKSYSIEQRDEAIEKANSAIKRLDERIEVLQSKAQQNAAEMSATMRIEMDEKLKKLKTKRDELSDWLGGIKHASSRAWNRIKEGFVDSYKSLSNSLEKAENELKS